MAGIILKDKDVFHVHTSRCGHAERVSDEEYVVEALSLGASSIWFTDHAPFPGDPFQGRMKYDELEEYLVSLSELKTKYNGFVRIGLEIEYFPSFDKSGYYKKLLDDKRIECLLLGQHMAEEKVNHYTFSWSKDKIKREEFIALGNALIRGISSGYFDVVAHPERIFRHCDAWTVEMTHISRLVANSSKKRNVPLEVNISSMKSLNYCWNNFWETAYDVKRVIGLDAHSVNELRNGYLQYQYHLFDNNSNILLLTDKIAL